MATGPRYNVDMRRRREGLTDYRQRLRLLKSGKPRLVVRISNRIVRAQVEVPGPMGDETLAAASSDELAAYGWEAPTGNLPSAHLTGILVGRRALGAEVDEAVLDVGLHSPTPGAKVFAVQEGAIDAGLDVPHNDAVLPAWSRTRGEHIAANAEELGEDYGDGFDPTAIPEHFDAVRERLLEGDLA
ncbi:MAG: 50S ribosomal protein L18 [Halobacteriales archaeon]